MQYVIDDQFDYRPADGALWNITQPENAIVLTSIPAKILCYLFEHQEKAVTREEFYAEVWDKYGLQASNNSLNQNISLLRKILQELGCRVDLIETVPHIGYMLNTQVFKVVHITDSAPASRTFTLFSLIRKPLPVLTGLMVILAGLAVSQMVFPSVNDIPAQQFYSLGNIGVCEIHTVFRNSRELTADKLSIAEKFMEAYLPCKENEFYVFQPEDRFVHDRKGRVFLSRCTYQGMNRAYFAGCKDIYVNKI